MKDRFKDPADKIIESLRRNEPVLKDPDGLTDEIMAALEKGRKGEEGKRRQGEEGKRRQGEKGKRGRGDGVIIIIQRLLAAASVALFLAFCYDEYIVLDKISYLEKQNSMVSHSESYKSSLQLKRVIKIIQGDPVLLGEYKKMQKAGILNAPLSVINAVKNYYPSKKTIGK